VIGLGTETSGNRRRAGALLRPAVPLPSEMLLELAVLPYAAANLAGCGHGAGSGDRGPLPIVGGFLNPLAARWRWSSVPGMLVVGGVGRGWPGSG